MTKEEYLKRIKNNINSLTMDEQSEALQFYSDYLDDADDVEKAMKDLGTPEEVAAAIIEKCSNALVSSKKGSKDNESEYYENEDGLFYKFKSVSSLNLNLGAAEVVLIKGKEVSVETRGLNKEDLSCSCDNDGNLYINNTRKLNINFLSHERNRRIVPRILITIPDKKEFDCFELRVGAGSFVTKDVTFVCNKGLVHVDAGNLVIGSIVGKNISARCGMGNLNISGKLTGKIDVDCGMGAVKFNLEGNKDDYSYDTKVGLGSFRINKDKKSGVCQYKTDDIKNNHFSVNVGMGSVIIDVQ